MPIPPAVDHHAWDHKPCQWCGGPYRADMDPDRTAATGTITAIERLANSRNGNPRYRITLEFTGLGTFAQAWNTAADHAFNYVVGNPGYRAGDTVTVTVGGRGTIVAMVAR